MTELVTPTVAGAGRIAAVLNARSRELNGMRVVRRRDTWERTA